MIGIEIAFLVGITKIAAIVYMVLQLFVMLVIVRQVMLVTKIIKTMYGFIVLALAFAHAIFLLLILILTIFVNPQL